jgi:hypothetical protein
MLVPLAEIRLTGRVCHLFCSVRCGIDNTACRKVNCFIAGGPKNDSIPGPLFDKTQARISAERMPRQGKISDKYENQYFIKSTRAVKKTLPLNCKMVKYALFWHGESKKDGT